ncbi:hypothetical protein [Anaerovorax sp. IOR16]|uniref:hypothetical protein n=1 Tax=Anaerovorax sp. IOR16 TaxID=2773458 RepID=UPI0019D25A96|nr:hypothetical protein [Anaerovorax sp. IOR16]
MIKLGKPPRGIIASGIITSEFYDSEHWNEDKKNKGETVRRVDIDFNRILDYDLDKILEQSDLKKMFPEQNWSPQGSGISIRNKYIEKLELVWDTLFTSEKMKISDNEYEDYLKVFEKFRFTYTQKREELEEKRLSFTKDYSIEKLRHMSLDEYVVGKQDKTSFCYRLENELQAWGDMHGSTSAKFGIYFGKKGSDHIQKYRWTKGYGNTKEEALDKVKEQLVLLIMAGKNYDIEKINQNKLSPMMKGKLLSLYYPHLYLNIFSSSHLDYFIAQLNIKETKNSMSEIEKQKLLLNYKDHHPFMRNWSIFEFSRCLYYLFGSPTNENKKGVAVEKSYLALVDIFVPISKTEYEIIELLPEKFEPNSDEKKVQGKKGKGNYEKQAKDNKRIGDRGS